VDSIIFKMTVPRTDDELQLQALGHKGELQRNFSLLSMLGLAFAILNWPYRVAAPLQSSGVC
jgi:hypothetical protein